MKVLFKAKKEEIELLKIAMVKENKRFYDNQPTYEFGYKVTEKGFRWNRLGGKLSVFTEKNIITWDGSRHALWELVTLLHLLEIAEEWEVISMISQSSKSPLKTGVKADKKQKMILSFKKQGWGPVKIANKIEWLEKKESERFNVLVNSLTK